MSNKLLFEIPSDCSRIHQIIEAIPDSWSTVSGILSSPAGLIATGQVALTTGLFISRFYETHPTIQGTRLDGEKRAPADLFALFCEQKRPAFVRFEDAGYDATKTMNLVVAKNIACFFVRLGYTGELIFISGYKDPCRSSIDNPERCFLHLAPWREIGHMGQDHPPMVKLTWHEQHGGKRENVEPIVQACTRLELVALPADTVKSNY